MIWYMNKTVGLMDYIQKMFVYPKKGVVESIVKDISEKEGTYQITIKNGTCGPLVLLCDDKCGILSNCVYNFEYEQRGMFSRPRIVNIKKPKVYEFIDIVMNKFVPGCFCCRGKIDHYELVLMRNKKRRIVVNDVIGKDIIVGKMCILNTHYNDSKCCYHVIGVKGLD